MPQSQPPSLRKRFQSTPSVGRATHKIRLYRLFPVISIHALRGEGDNSTSSSVILSILFQSTPSVGRATTKTRPKSSPVTNFNPRPPWGGRPAFADIFLCVVDFNPRPPWGGRRHRLLIHRTPSSISIHALRGEGDVVAEVIPTYCEYFNPRPPWGGRHYSYLLLSIFFNISIHALRGEGDYGLLLSPQAAFYISIHALRGEGDAIRGKLRRLLAHFNPRPPWGGRPFP